MNLERENVGERAGRGETPPGDDRDSPAQRFRVRQDVRAEKHGASLVSQFEDERSHVAAAQRIEARHRLVEKHHLRVVQKGLRDADALDHALRKPPQLQATLGPNAHAIEERGDALAPVGAVVPKELAEITEQLFRRQVIVEGGILRKIANALARREVADRTSEDLSAPRCRENQLHEQLERGGLAGSVGPEEPEHFPRFDVERQPIERPIRPPPPEADRVILGELLDKNRGGHSGGASAYFARCNSSSIIASSPAGSTTPAGSFLPFRNRVGVEVTPSWPPRLASARTSFSVSA